jgi:hypothetical protein
MPGHDSELGTDRSVGIDAGSEFVSFIVRIWKPVQGKQHGCRGWVEEVESGEKTSFLGLNELQKAISGFLLRES